MKKALALFAVFLISLSFSACGPRNKKNGSSGEAGQKKYNEFQAESVGEIPWNAHGEVEDYK